MLDTYSDRIKYALNLRNMPAIELSKQTGISKGAISSYINGTYKPKQDTIYLMSKVLRVNPLWLMGLTDSIEITPLNEVSNWLGEVLKDNDEDIIRFINKISKLSKNEMLMLEAIVDSYLNKKD